LYNLSVLDAYHGDFTHSWDPSDEAQVKNAREMFDTLKKNGYSIYETKTEDGEVVHDVVHNFDAIAGAYKYEEPKDLPNAEGEQSKGKQYTATPAKAGG
jgi:hypothetical protein